MPNRMLEGVKVADFGQTGTGPMTARYLADHGATVVALESAAKIDILRTNPPFYQNKPGYNRSGFFAECDANKYGICVNIRHPHGLDVAKRLVAWSDVVLENFAPGSMNRMGLGYEELKKIKPDIIMIGMSLQGQTGAAPGFGAMVSSLIGLTYLTGFPDEPVAGTYGAYPDFVTPRFGICAVLSALLHKRQTGQGQFIDIAQSESTLQFLMPLLLDYEVNKRIPPKMGNRSPCAAPHGAYRCLGDDRWCAITVTNDAEWRRFCRVLGSPAWSQQRRFATLLGRKKNEDELDKLIESWTCGYSAEEVMTILQSAGVPAGICQNGQDTWEDPQIRHRGYHRWLDHAEMGHTVYSAYSFNFSKTPSEIRMPAPLLNEHTEFVCTNFLGMSPEEFQRLKAEGVFE